MGLRQAALSLIMVWFIGIALWGNDAGKSTTVKGYVLDSACAFTKGLNKPISAD